MPSLNTKLASAPNTTSNYVLKATSSTTIGNSIIQDNGSTATVGGALTATGQVEGTIINSTSNAFRLNGNNALSLVTLNSQSVVKINAAGFWGTQLVGANDKGLLIDNNGNGMIGTTTSSGYGNINFDLNAGASNAAYFVIRTGNNSTIAEYALDGGVAYLSTKTAHPLVFRTSDVERMRITSGGQIMINTTSNVFSTAAQMEFLYVGQSRFGINMKTTTGDGLPLNFINSSGSQVGYIYTTTNSTQYSTSSDYRLKQDLKDYNGLDILSKIKTYDYEWKSDKSRMHGVMAHELQEVIPYAVSGEKDGERMQGVDYSTLVPILIKSIQEQQAMIEAQQQQINQLINK